ncbi:glucosaminidase domain-containing protein [Vibrio sp. WXL210]|uniref:glucosaminidase domain-containing protein n=1 Tax=Vibrio sp. WXL210 TaxID=3450709 RepID=UPI003EC7DA88
MRKTEVSVVIATCIVAIASCVSYETSRETESPVEEQTKSQPEQSQSIDQNDQEIELATQKPDFDAIADIPTKKQTFFDYLRPGIAVENQRIAKERELIEQLAQQPALSSEERAELVALGEEYRLTFPKEGESTQRWFEVMLQRVDTLPPALVLTQAANESAWGASRFATEANNYFGQWCYSEGCGLVPNQRPAGMTYEVAKFSSAAESTHRYFMNVNRNSAYVELRQMRSELREQGQDLESIDAANVLAGGLTRYSERGQYYVDDIRAMIRHNHSYWQ